MIQELITHIDPKSPISEVFRSLRTNIQFMNSKLDTLLVTSTMQSEGKSWTTSNLATTFAQAGKKVIIVDADMRKGRQYGIFGIAPRPGLSNFLSGIDENGQETEEGILHYIKETAVENLFIIPAGNVPPNPSELLVSEKMQELITSLKEICDLIIFDGTPSLLVTDSVILSRLVDSTIIVTSYKDTKMDNLQKIKKDIENVGGKVSGVIINKVPISQKKYESRYYYGSTSSSGGHKPLKKLNTANGNMHQSKLSDLQKNSEKNAVSNIGGTSNTLTKSLDSEEILISERAKNIQQIDKKTSTIDQIGQTADIQQSNSVEQNIDTNTNSNTNVQQTTNNQQSSNIYKTYNENQQNNNTYNSQQSNNTYNNQNNNSYNNEQQNNSSTYGIANNNNDNNNERQSNSSYQTYNVDQQSNSTNFSQESKTLSGITLNSGVSSAEKTEELLKKINNYLEAEKGKLNN